jgi:DNA-binding winged helix-turn-helix (wHTH) protein/Tol biopolymer transport system component
LGRCRNRLGTGKDVPFPKKAGSFMGTDAVRFGVFQLKKSSKELRKHGVPLRLSGHSLAILMILLEKPGEIVTREEIQKRLWQADTFVDFQHGLNTAMKKLRGVLGDSPENARYIETIPRVGYRFIAPVQEVVSASQIPLAEKEASAERLGATPAASGIAATGAEAAQIPASAPNSEPRFERRAAPAVSLAARSLPARGKLFPHAGRWIAALIAAAVVIVVPRILVLAARTPQIASVRPLTNTSRIESFGEIETDGARLFFLERKGHKWNLMQMPASGGEAQPFSIAFENTKILAVSPDASEMIVSPFVRREELLPIYLMDSVGGAPRALGNISATDATFTADGQEITYATADGIYQVRRDGLNQRALVTLAGPKTDLDWSPDGRTLRFTCGVMDGDPSRDASEVWELDVASGKVRAVLPGWDTEPMQCCGKWTRDGKYFAFISRNHGGSPHVWMLGRRGIFSLKNEQPTVLSSGPVPFSKLLSGRDGRHLFALGFNGHTEYVSVDPQSRAVHTLLGGSSAAWISLPTEEKWVVSERSDGAVWRSRADGSEPVQLVANSLHPTLASVSADGEEVVFEGDPDNTHVPRVYVVATNGGSPQLLISGAVAAEAPQLAGDRSRVVYASPDAGTGVFSLYVLDRKSGEKRAIEGSTGMRVTRWSPDGRYLAAVAEDNARITLLDWQTQTWTEIAKGNVFGPPSWSADSKSIYYQDILEPEEPIHRAGLDARALDSFPACGALLAGNVLRCGFEALGPHGEFILQLTRGDHDLFSLELKMP